MSIARMKKLSVIGLASAKDDLIEALMKIGVVEISAQDSKLSDDEWKNLIKQDGSEKAASDYESRISKVSQVLDSISKYGTGSKPLIRTRKSVDQKSFEKAMQRKDEIEKKVEHIYNLSIRLSEVNASENKTESLRLSLLPWESFDIPLEVQATKETEAITGVVPVAADADRLIKDVAEKTDRCVINKVSSDSEQHYLSVIYLKKEKSDIEDILRLYGFNRVIFGELKGTAAENIAVLDKKLTELSEEKAKVISEIQSEEGSKEDVELLHDALIIKRDQAAIRNRLLVTKKTFYLDGWVPKMAAEKVEKLLTENGCYYEIEDPKKGEETPILLMNGKFSGPFESITKLYALPGSAGIDATPFFSLSYAVFFGMMLADMAYGLILAGVSLYVLKSFRLEGMFKQLIQLFVYCGIATIFWGAMFGGFFGDLITVVAKTFFDADIVIRPLWFNPLEDPMTLLLFSFALGGVHLFIGMGLGAYLAIKDGRPFDAFCDVFLWYVLLIGVTLMLTGFAAGTGKWMAIIGAAGILLTGGRHKKGFGKIIGGLTSLYGITSYLADVLSYSRLLGLGLASAVIASVVNTMGTLAGGGITGVIILLIAFFVGHSYNMAINALGSFVHSCRLEYVEFFGKFYESGGAAFEPFSERTKYIDILREEK